MKLNTIRVSVLCMTPLILAGAAASMQPELEKVRPIVEAEVQELKRGDEQAMRVEYLEIVTPMVKETCESLAETHGITFSDPIPEFGNARTADLRGGGRIGVRAPMRATENPVVRPYLLVDDINAAVETAKDAGAVIALPPMDIPGQGKFSIYILGGIEHGLWQN